MKDRPNGVDWREVDQGGTARVTGPARRNWLRKPKAEHPPAASPTITLPTPAATTMAAASSPQETSDQLMSELGRSWDLLLAGDNVHVLKNNPQTGTGS